jgi:CRP/FNR family cyclic AMP-dependent transcriptional regulator
MAAPLLDADWCEQSRDPDTDSEDVLRAQLRECELFASLPESELDELATDLTLIDVREGESVFEQGDQGDALYLVLSGRIKLRRRTRDERNSLGAIIGAGEYFGELSLLDAGPRTADALAASDSQLAKISRQFFVAWAERNPQFALQALNCISRRLKRTYDEREDLLYTDTRTRLSKKILALTDRFGSLDAKGRTVVNHGLTQEDLAQLIGSSRETVSKVLAEFSRRGWIHVEGRAIVILNQPGLARRARLWPAPVLPAITPTTMEASR